MALIDNLAAYYPLDEASGDALDAHGSSDLTDHNTVGAGTGVVSGARDFEANNTEYFSRADSAALSTGDVDFTVQAWVKLESKAAYQTFVAHDDSASDRGWALYHDIAADRFKFFVRLADNSGHAEVTASTLGTPATATWYLIHCWHDAANNQIGIAVNAGTADTASHSTGVRDSGAAFAIGAQFNGGSPSNPADALIDEVGLWKRVLAAQERTDLYNGGAGLAYASFGGGGGGGGAGAGLVARGLVGASPLVGGRLVSRRPAA